MLSPLFETLSDLPSDHYGVVGSLNFPKPHCTTKTIQRRDLKRLEHPNVAILTASCLKHSIVSKTSIENPL